MVVYQTHQGHSEYSQRTPRRLKEKAQPSAVDKTTYSLTVYDHPHILEETVDDLKRLRCRRPSLVLGQSVQPLKDGIDTILSEKFLYKFLCIALSQVIC